MNDHQHSLPTEFTNLSELAHNLWWSWSPEGQAVFSYFDQTLWRLTHQNPMKQMQEIHPTRLESLRDDVVFIRQYQAAMNAYHEYLTDQEHWFGTTYPHLKGGTIAYFSAEFGLHRSVPL